MPRHTRRTFLETASIAGAAPSPKPAAFRPKSTPRKISDNLYLFEDTCNVFIVRQGSRAILIDFGSGAVLDHLAALGIQSVDWVLHTHHHRDQCQGDQILRTKKIQLAVPAHEAHLFSDAENFWRNRRVFHLYYVRNDFNTITRNIPVDHRLADYSTFRWQNIDFFVLPTPGHTLGSISLLATIDSRRVAFTGDLFYAPGKILTLHDTQINYGGAEGIDMGIYSLARLAEQNPALVCPSHGDPIDSPDGAIRQTIRHLTDYYRFQTGNQPVEEGLPFAVSPHLVAHYLTNSSFYAIISSSGKAMFIDYGSASQLHFANFMTATATTDRIRFVEHSIARLRRDHGLKSVDVAMPSHMHDDHMNGFPHLVRHLGTRIWCYDNMVDVFQNPRGYNLGCILAEPVKIDRAFRDGETFKWEEFEFEVKHSPGHTNYQMALFTKIDGRRVAFTGDAFFPNPQNDGTLRHNLIFRNEVQSDSHLRSIRNMLEREPEMICPGHGRPYPVTRDLLTATEQKFRRQQQFFQDLLPEGETDFAMNPSWLRFYPYQILLAPGETRTIELHASNYSPSPMNLEIALVAPSEWRIAPETCTLRVPPNSQAKTTVSLTIPRDWTPPAPRFAIAADVLRDGKYIGQITEAVIEIRGALSS